MSTFGWESLRPLPESLRLADETAAWQVAAKLRNVSGDRRLLVLKLRNGDRWSHVVMDEDFTTLAQGFGEMDKTSWEVTRAILRGKGLEVA